MGGPRANCFLKEGNEILFITENYDGTNIPDYVLTGESEYIDWMKEFGQAYSGVRLQGVKPPADSAYAEGAILADIDSKTLIIGFDCWQPEFENGSIPEIYEQFHHYSELRPIFTETVASFWPDWTIHYADHRDFGVGENVQYDFEKIKPLGFKHLKREISLKQVTRGFRDLLEAREAESAKSRRG